MNYTEQEEFLESSRFWGIALAAALAATAALCLRAAQPVNSMTFFALALAIAALTVSLFYAPNYLRLTVNPEKRRNWQIRIRWRLLAAALIVGLLLAPGTHNALIVIASIAWLTGAN